jgi:hypothetical protein
VRELRILSIFFVFVLGLMCPNWARANASNTRTDKWGVVELSGSDWLDGRGVTVYSNGPSVSGPASDTYNYMSNKNGDTTQTGIEWQCVELINRLYLTRGWITSTWYGNGNSLYANAPIGLTKEPNGSITYLNPGDVVTLDDGGNGHAGIINSVTNNSVQIVNQNTVAVYSSATFKNKTITMNGWSGYVVQGVIHAPLNEAIWGGVGSASYRGDTLVGGDALYNNQYLASANVQHALVFQLDGNLVLYHNGRVSWQSGTGGQHGTKLVMQTDGNLVIYRADGSVVWSSGSGGHPWAYATLQSDGNFVVRDTSQPFWWTGTGGHQILTYYGSDRLLPGQQLNQNQYLRSSDGRYAVLLQGDGNLVLYGPGYHVLWQSGTGGNGDRLIMQTDGNLVLYAITTAVWWKGTGTANTYVVLQNDGNFVEYNSGNFPVWYSATGGQI